MSDRTIPLSDIDDVVNEHVKQIQACENEYVQHCDVCLVTYFTSVALGALVINMAAVVIVVSPISILLLQTAVH
jgi:hypothetical protein